MPRCSISLSPKNSPSNCSMPGMKWPNLHLQNSSLNLHFFAKLLSFIHVLKYHLETVHWADLAFHHSNVSIISSEFSTGPGRESANRSQYVPFYASHRSFLVHRDPSRRTHPCPSLAMEGREAVTTSFVFLMQFTFEVRCIRPKDGSNNFGHFTHFLSDFTWLQQFSEKLAMSLPSRAPEAVRPWCPIRNSACARSRLAASAQRVMRLVFSTQHWSIHADNLHELGTWGPEITMVRVPSSYMEVSQKLWGVLPKKPFITS